MFKKFAIIAFIVIAFSSCQNPLQYVTEYIEVPVNDGEEQSDTDIVGAFQRRSTINTRWQFDADMVYHYFDNDVETLTGAYFAKESTGEIIIENDGEIFIYLYSLDFNLYGEYTITLTMTPGWVDNGYPVYFKRIL